MLLVAYNSQNYAGIIYLSLIRMSLLPHAHVQQGVKQLCCPSVHGQRNIEKAEIHGYSFRKGYYNNICTIWEDHSADSVIFNLLEMKNPVIFPPSYSLFYER